ncbi:MAG: hypothetical protein AAF581_00405 [Planctomycetota bacterium]
MKRMVWKVSRTRLASCVGLWVVGSVLVGGCTSAPTNARDADSSAVTAPATRPAGVDSGSVSASKPHRSHGVFPSMAARVANPPLDPPPDDGFDWQTNGPLEFLDFLEQGLGQQGEGWPPCFTISGTHRGWIRESDIPALLSKLDSDAPCLATVKTISSILPREPSTVGNEAAHMIVSYRSEVRGTGYGGYPTYLNSTMYETDREELRRWWRDYQREQR